MTNEQPGRVAAFFIAWIVAGLLCLCLALRAKNDDLDRRQRQMERPIGSVMPYPRPF